ncbi:zinc-dependent alcohol dehydrogenase [Sulfobacillus thermosulfidooxidans]|uniref:zinc-dependent alcohol dehydrogenase n=1 Tax=Sulfobacillus thermosulfidooxidans TaxID=28034 RepID=UPI001493FC7E|nr:alcohol dehydrogenase catalytic domain-containing protein [Sulfobacillus thermosulfidooxidans]
MEIAPLLAGICGSDRGLILGHSSPYLAPLTKFPAVLGHEVVGRVVEDSPQWSKGTVVVVNPALSCTSLALKNPCPACRKGRPDLCYYRGQHDIGLLMGFHTHFPGGFAERMWVPSHQVYQVPSEMKPERAVLTEPLSIVLYGLSHIEWSSVHRVLVIGSGTIGLLTLFALQEKDLTHDLVMAVARYPHQQKWAKRLGAEVVSNLSAPALTEITGTPYPHIWHTPSWRPRGFDLVIDAAGSSSSLQGAISCVRPGGQILLLGAANEMKWDFTPIWSKDITFYGTYGYGPNPDQTFNQALNLLHTTTIPIEQLITHTFFLDDYQNAFATLENQGREPIKICFKPRDPDFPPKA